MRTEDEVNDFKSRAFHKYIVACKECKGNDFTCQCRRKFDIAVSAYEGCVPQDFWHIKPSDITHNNEIFKQVVQQYVNNMNRALKRGYGLLFLGDNGVGKTYFISYVLMEAIKRGRTVYYTTMPDLDFNIKRGFKQSEIEERLYWMLTSDFLAIDEMGKERAKADNKYMDAQVERILKRRLDDSNPMLLATNMDFEKMGQAYGATVASMLAGKFQAITMEPGDYREKIHEEMTKEMGYNDEI